MTLQDAVEEFLLAGSADGLADTTLKWYASLLRKLTVTIHNPELTTITASQIRTYLRYLRTSGLSEDTLHGHTRALHRFFRWYSEETQTPNPMEHIKYPRQPKPKVPKAASIADVLKLFEVCGDSDVGKRNKAILAFLLDTGCRAAGLTSLTIDGLDMERRRAIVLEKGNELRTVFFSPATAELISAWLLVRNPASNYVFHSKTGRRMRADNLGMLLARLKKKAGVTGRVNPHSFRHGFAREYILSGGDMGTLSRILGHKDIQTTQNSYAIFLTDELARLHDRFSPMQQIKPRDE
jgi:site-specific recombinase XerD